MADETNIWKIGCLVAVLMVVGSIFIGTASEWDVGDPAISVKMLASEEFMPDLNISWEPMNGPPGGSIDKLIQNPYGHNELYASTVRGVYKSEDKGESWRLMDGLEGVEVVSIAAFEDKLFLCGNGVYYYNSEENLVKVFDDWCNLVAVSDNKLFVTVNSEDVGELGILYTDPSSEDFDWADISPSASELRDLVIPPDDAGLWYSITVLNIVALGNRILASIIVEVDGSGEFTNGHLYISEDLGETWSKVTLDVPDDVIIANIVQNPANHEHIFLLFRHPILHDFTYPVSELIRASYDGGNTWSPVTDLALESNGITDVDIVGSVYYLISPFDGLQILKLDGSSYEQIGMPRVEEFEEITFNLDTLLFDFDDPNIVYGKTGSVWELGILKSEDGMRTWEKMDGDIIASSPTIVAPHPTDPSTVFTSGNVIQESYLTRDGGNTWEPFTPTNAGDEVKIDPHDSNHILLIDESTNIYESYDSGRTFVRIAQDFSSAKVFDFEIAEDNPDTIYISNLGTGISEYFPSQDDDPWRHLTNSPDYVYDIEIDPEDSNILYASYSPKIFENFASVNKYDKNQEENSGWIELLRAENATGISSIKIDPSNPDNIYVGVTGNEGEIYSSTDRGQTWSKLNDYFTMCTVWGQPQLIIDPNNPAIAYIGTWLAGTWKTMDAGATWMLLQDAPLSSTALSLNIHNTDVIYLADRSSPTVWKSIDAGSTWEKIGDFTSDGALLVMRVLADDSTVYASTFEPCLQGGKLYKSTNSGLDWTDITGTLPKGILDVAVDPTNSDVIYVTTNINGAHKSTDGGTTWNVLENFPDVGAYDIEVDPDDPTILYTSARGGSLPGWFTEIDGEPEGITFTDDAGVYKSTNSGENWSKILATTASCRAIRRHPNYPDLLFAPDLVDGLQMSTDGGNNWTSYNTGLDNAVVTSCAVGGDKIYVGTQGCGVYSGDIDMVSGSITWQPTRSNKPVPEVYNIQIGVDPANSNNIFVASYPGGLYCSSDGGTTFRDKNAITPSVVVDYPFIQGYYTFAINPINSSRMWVGTWGKGIYKSYNAMSLNVPAVGTDYKMQDKHINQIAIDPNHPNDVYVATQEGVFMTCDDGEHWQEMNAGLETLDVRSLKITNVEWQPFENDFEDGSADEWDLEDGWSVIPENGNYVLQGVGHKWANAGSRDWMDYTFESKIKKIEGCIHVNFRQNENGRYFVGFAGDGIGLYKQYNGWEAETIFEELGYYDKVFDDGWHNLKITVKNNSIKVSVDGQQLIDVNDNNSTHQSGSISYETLENSIFYVDNVYVTIDPIGSIVYAGTAGYGIYRLNPIDKKWQNLGRTLGGGWWSAWDRRMYQFSSLLFDPDVPGKVYYGHFPSGFFISEDNGHTWNASNLGIGNDGMFSLSMHPQNHNILFAGTYNGIAKSVDGGKTWEMKSSGMPLEQWPYTVAIDDTNPNIMYVSTKNGQNKGFCHRNEFCGVVMKSTDGGESWFKIMNGLDDKNEFYTLLIYPPDHNILFLSTSNGVYLSKDTGNSWEGINNGLPVTRNQVRDNVADNLALTPDNKNLILGLVNYGVWKAELLVETTPLSMTDAIIALQIAVGNRPFDSRWDVNGDGKVTSLDALMIMQAAADGVET